MGAVEKACVGVRVRGGGVDTDRLPGCGAGGADVARLAERYRGQLEGAQLVDTPELCLLAATVLRERDGIGFPLAVPVLLLDVPVHDEATLALVRALASRASRFAATIPAGDERTRTALLTLPSASVATPAASASSSGSPEVFGEEDSHRPDGPLRTGLQEE